MTAVVEMVEGDLLAQDVEAIVNAWNRNWIPEYRGRVVVVTYRG